MKKLKQIFTALKSKEITSSAEDLQLLWQLICYPPKMALRLHQETLLNEADRFTLTVNDEYYTGKQLTFSGFKWGSGKHKIYLTHGWGSKAADFTEMIRALQEIDEVQIIAYDVPGNGSFESELSNLLLFVETVKAVIKEYGEPEILIGHSLGAMANIIALKDLNITPSLLISITPLIRLKENFIATMDSVDTPKAVQEVFFNDFEKTFHGKAASFNLNALYPFAHPGNHWLAYDEYDQIAPDTYLQEFLSNYPGIINNNYDGAGHDRIIKSSQLITDLIALVKAEI